MTKQLVVSFQTHQQSLQRRVSGRNGVGYYTNIKRQSIRTRAVQKIGGDGKKENLFQLPIFESRQVLHPTYQGQLIAYEAKYVQLFEEANKKLKEQRGDEEAQFLHILSTESYPQPLQEKLQKDIVDGLFRIGVCCQILQIEKDQNQNLVVDYEAKRRVNLIGVLPPEDIRLYKEALVEWYDDEEVGVDQIWEVEQDLHSCLKEVSQINQKLDKSEVHLPTNVLKYSPPPQQEQYRQYNKGGWGSSGSLGVNGMAYANILTWQRSSPQYKKSQPVIHDVYQMVGEKVNRQMRQELFSFACLDMLELKRIDERIVLAQSQDTAGRMEWILFKYVKPYLEQLRTQYKIKRALNE